MLLNAPISKCIRIGIIGANNPLPENLKLCEEMGRAVAEAGFILVNGGGRGAMQASAKGAKSADGFVIGILPGNDMEDANEFTDIAIPTDMGHGRNSMVILNSHYVVAIGGRFGTLTEIAYSGVYNKRVYGLNSWNVESIIQMPSPSHVIKDILEQIELSK